MFNWIDLKWIGIGALLGVFILAATSAFACAVKAPRADIVAQLSEKYNEAPIVVGDHADGIMEVWAEREGKGWSVLFTNKEGITCLMMAGSTVFIIRPDLPSDGA